MNVVLPLNGSKLKILKRKIKDNKYILDNKNSVNLGIIDSWID